MRRISLVVGAFALVAGLSACASKADQPTFTMPSTAPVSEPSPIPSETVGQPSPSATATTASPSPSQSPKPACKEGKAQLAVEEALNAIGGFGKLTADGKQSDADCAAIKKFQSRFGLRPVDGVAGNATQNVANRIRASDPAKCGAGSGLTACIDLTNQTTYLMRDGKVIYGPTVTRTGYDHPDGKGAPTPSGSYRIIERQRSNYTDSFNVYLHYWQRIMGNNGFHETTSYIHDMSLGSHGCVNLLKADAIKYWDTLAVGTPVKVFGRRPGT